MLQKLYAIGLAIGMAVHPEVDHSVNAERQVARVVAGVVAQWCRPDQTALGSCEKDAAGMMVTAYQEGQFCAGTGLCLRGDQGRSSSTFQVMGFTPEQTELYDRDMVAAARHAYVVMREGSKACPDEPLAPYCGGCNNRAARRIAHARLEKIDELFATLLAVEGPK